MSKPRPTKPKKQKTLTAGGALLTRLKLLGVDYIFANSGTDFPPIIEGLAEAQATGWSTPTAMVIPHEHAALGMAHGYYLATAKAQAVLLHTNVGLANGAIGAINAATDHVPVIMMSGRTPTTEHGRFGSRTVPIGWGQEMRDQTALVREASKWDYELRFPEQIGMVTDRALAIASSTPKGPVYVSLPREVLCEPCPVEGLDAPASMAPALAGPPPDAIAEAARLLSTAKRPLIIAQHGAGSHEAFLALSRLAADWAIPVCQYWAIGLAVPFEHPCYVGMNPAPWLAKADVVLAIDCLAPWSPDIHNVAAGAKVIHLGPNPLQSRFPIRNFPASLSIATETDAGLLALAEAMSKLSRKKATTTAKRRSKVIKASDAHRAAVRASTGNENDGPISKAWVSRCIGRAIQGHTATVLSELAAPLDPLELSDHNSWRQEPCSGGLGWSFPCGMGMKLGDPDRLIVATMGDGSYMFSNPVACHQIAEAHRIGILVVVLNNGEWGAVRQSVTGLYPDGHAVRANQMPLTGLTPSPDFAAIAAASRAYSETVSERADVPGALERALDVVIAEKRLALLNVLVRD